MNAYISQPLMQQTLVALVNSCIGLSKQKVIRYFELFYMNIVNIGGIGTYLYFVINKLTTLLQNKKKSGKM